jgi:heptosyltransferase-1
MTEILFIKTSSLGDVIHHMPAVAESRVHFPRARISWLVEEAYAPLVALHPAVDDVIPVAWRRWRRRLLANQIWREIGDWRRRIGARQYDRIVDTQGLIRTAIMGRAAHGPHHGYDRNSIREPLASRFYDVRFPVSRDLHAIERNRRLTALALGYRSEGAADYGLDRAALRTSGDRYAVLLHGTARPEKEWPVAHWIELGKILNARDLAVLVPWGSDAERVRAAEIVAALPNARVADRQPIDEVAKTVAGAACVIGGDTGLVHLAAALGVPLVAIFSGSDPALTRPVGAGPIEVVGTKGTTPSVEDVSASLEKILR